ncbi:hypothetical protein GGQ74_000555 [Desulfobaculum xiamenense]|uniref:M23ase beta-sheet core domain-containing protein n=1 Tax=Desulfobaculum xiamenense TaxID=995050 RepID=A0A846QND1_9BACT|nr:M23 family metallopeptidase [Desulfobaculum xiamenense]NJB66915.1 hypothetical protein [Desulfobaculum xiamenense]
MKKIVSLSIVLFLVAALGISALFYFKDMQEPELALTPNGGFLGAETVFTLEANDLGTGIRTLTVTARQGDKTVTLLSTDTFEDPTHAVLNFTHSQAKFRNGQVVVTVDATDRSIYGFGAGNTASKSWTFELDTKKPMISVLSTQHNVSRGGVGCVAYTVNEDVSESGIRVGEEFFRGYKQANGQFLCFFTFPHYMEEKDFAPMLFATDLAGNTRKGSFYYHLINKPFRHDTINLSDGFLNAKMPQFEDDYPDAANQLERYLLVNRELRVKNRAAMHELGAKSESRPLWQGRFERLPNAANRAQFGDHRTYLYNGQEVDQQTHLGIDLASVQNAPIPAANSGKVVFTGFFGIYGETVVIDHGCGLMTLYAHMNEISVNVGDMVEKSQIIGNTGATGLAGGDHLHYGVFLSGVPVNPIEWWDATWIKNNITSRM